MPWVACRVRWKHKKENKKKKKDKAQDLYKQLGLEDIRWMATESQIKKAYQKAALKHHPDKACAGVEDAAEKARIEEKFKSILVRIKQCSCRCTATALLVNIEPLKSEFSWRNA
jgi:preprotein translocase subunit Sec63